MKAIKFDLEFTDASIKDLFKEIDSINKDENIILYFCSSGGHITTAAQLADYINRNKERFTIVIDWECSSAAFLFLCLVNCEVIINNTAFAIIHLISNDISYRLVRDRTAYPAFAKKRLDADRINLLNELTYAGFNKAELKLIDNGQDIIIDSIRMKYVVEKVKAYRRQNNDE
jgi:hypothetical protein